MLAKDIVVFVLQKVVPSSVRAGSRIPPELLEHQENKDGLICALKGRGREQIYMSSLGSLQVTSIWGSTP